MSLIHTFRIASPFQNGMIFQRGHSACIWGWDEPHTTLLIEMAGLSFPIEADSSGRWEILLPPPPPDGSFELVVRGSREILLRNLVAGEVWLAAGQSNMEMIVRDTAERALVLKKANDPDLRFFRVPNQSSHSPARFVEATWTASSTETVDEFSAVAWHFAHRLREELQVPIGVIQAAWGASSIISFLPPSQLEASGDLPMLEDRVAQCRADWETTTKAWKDVGEVGAPPPPIGCRDQHIPGTIFHGMFCPLFPLSLRGAIWYQGENNAGEPENYRRWFALLLATWREKFRNPQLPVYFAQLPGINEPNRDWRAFRLMQAEIAASLENVDMAVTFGAGGTADESIHPLHKQVVGERLARLALHYDYGRDDLLPGGPRVRGFTSTPAQIRVSFDRVGTGLQLRSPLRFDHWQWRMEDGMLCDAIPRVVNASHLEFALPTTGKPVALEYAQRNADMEPQLFNSENLPASPFTIRL